MAGLTLRNVCKKYDNGFQAVSDFNLEIKDREFIIFVGPSGCGKSTTLRMIAGLEEISDGELWIGNELVNYREPRDRDLSMVFQNYALYPTSANGGPYLLSFTKCFEQFTKEKNYLFPEDKYLIDCYQKKTHYKQ